MSRLNHDRPVFKVIDAGGGERIRTIAEDLRAAQAADRREARRAVPAGNGPLRCRACGSAKNVQKSRRCVACAADEQRIKKAQQRLDALRTSGAMAAGPTVGAKKRRVIQAAKTDIAARRRANGSRVPEPRKPSSGTRATSTPRPNVQAAERAAEAARKELLLARTEWEKQVLRQRYRRAQEAVTRAQRVEGQRRSLT